MTKGMSSGNRNSKIFLIIAILAIMQSVLRLVFFYLGTFGGSQLITPPPPASLMQFINAFSLALGLAGLLAIPGLMFYKSWGYLGTILVCGVTLAFDLWAFSTVAQTAAAGLVVPIIALIYLVPRRAAFLHHSLLKS